ncbi:MULTISPECIES: hypothetical protein [unclassified Kitasatospora]|uniref:hypothetical protein n=1 Tax=unclassified Kitasatospora TaxID=2633591 RepID=UPI0033F95FFF
MTQGDTSANADIRNVLGCLPRYSAAVSQVTVADAVDPCDDRTADDNRLLAAGPA